MIDVSLEPHREFLIEILQDDRVYSVAGLRQLALLSNYSGDLDQLTQALIWNYRSHNFLEKVDGFESIKGKRYSAWTRSRWKSLRQDSGEHKDPECHWLKRIPGMYCRMSQSSWKDGVGPRSATMVGFGMVDQDTTRFKRQRRLGGPYGR